MRALFSKTRFSLICRNFHHRSSFLLGFLGSRTSWLHLIKRHWRLMEYLCEACRQNGRNLIWCICLCKEFSIDLHHGDNGYSGLEISMKIDLSYISQIGSIPYHCYMKSLVQMLLLLISGPDRTKPLITWTNVGFSLISFYGIHFGQFHSKHPSIHPSFHPYPF